MSLPSITAAQYAALRFLRREDVGFLRDVPVLRGPVVAVMCSDGHQILEKLQYLESRTEHSGEACQHIIATNGGALVLAEDSPIASDVFEGTQVRMDACCMINVVRGCTIKQPKTLVLKTHFPCAMARGLSVAEVLTFQAKGHARIEGTVLRRLRENGITSVEQAVCHVHVNYRGYHNANGTRRTYVFDPRDTRIANLAAYIEEGALERQCA